MILIDTGYLIGMINRRDHLHDRALAWTAATTNESQFVTRFVVIEAINAFSGTGLRKHCQILIDSLLAAGRVTEVKDSDRWYTAGLDLHRDRADKDWSLTDCISFAVMEHHGIRRALAHDHHFEQAGFEALLRRDPD